MLIFQTLQLFIPRTNGSVARCHFRFLFCHTFDRKGVFGTRDSIDHLFFMGPEYLQEKKKAVNVCVVGAYQQLNIESFFWVCCRNTLPVTPLRPLRLFRATDNLMYDCKKRFLPSFRFYTLAFGLLFKIRRFFCFIFFPFILTLSIFAYRLYQGTVKAELRFFSGDLYLILSFFLHWGSHPIFTDKARENKREQNEKR